MTDWVCICCTVMNNPELPLDPNLQTSNLLITFLKYASIVMQDTKGKEKPYLIWFFFFFFNFFPSVSLVFQLLLHANRWIYFSQPFPKAKEIFVPL